MDTDYLEKSDTYMIPAPDSGIGKWTWLFKGKKEGSTDLVLQYKRKWEKQAKREFTVTIRITE